MAETTHLGQLLSQLRKDRNHSMRHMAKLCGISRESIRKYELGLLIPSNQAIAQIFQGLEMDPDVSREAVVVLMTVYQARRERSSGEVRSFGPAAQAKLEETFTNQDGFEVKADKLVELFFSEVGPDRRNDSFEFFLRNKVMGILRS